MMHAFFYDIYNMNRHILLIDDDDDELYFFTEALRETKYCFTCIAAKSVEEGMRILGNARPEFIFLDINMPRIDGFEGLRLIKKLDGINHIPVILYSTAVNQEVMESGLLQGATACMKKTALYYRTGQKPTKISGPAFPVAGWKPCIAALGSYRNKFYTVCPHQTSLLVYNR